MRWSLPRPCNESSIEFRACTVDTHGPERTGESAAVRLSNLKGSTRDLNTDLGRGLLREELDCTIQTINFVHAPDEAAVAVATAADVLAANVLLPAYVAVKECAAVPVSVAEVSVATMNALEVLPWLSSVPVPRLVPSS